MKLREIFDYQVVDLVGIESDETVYLMWLTVIGPRLAPAD